MFYDLTVTYGNLKFYDHEDLYKATYSPNVMKISTRLRKVPTYALDWATIVAHIPWISHSMNFGVFYGSFYVRIVLTYALDWANIVAHIPWISHSMDFGLFYGSFYVEVVNFSGPKLEGKNTTT